MDKFDGQIVKITEVIDNDRIHFENDDDWFWRYSDKHFEIVEPSSNASTSIKYSEYCNPEKIWVERQNAAILYGQQMMDLLAGIL